MASFAVAMVLVVRFPKARWVIIPVAVAIAASRILRGAHFLTDIAGGAVLGALIGTVVANPWKDWRVSLESALFKLTPVLAGLLVAVWTIGHRASDHWPSPQLIGIGLAITLIALVGHGLPVLKPAFRSSYFTRSLARTLIGLGIGMFTGSVWVATTVLLVCLAFWLRSDVTEPDTTAPPRRLWVQEAAFGLAVLLTLYAMFELRGALPLL
jgi:undecaprenyl-diphosphatase